MLGGPKELGTIRSDRVGAGFFETTGIPVIRGRGFTSQDVTGEAHVLIVNETMARQVWPGQDPLGQRLEFDDQPQQVIGVARDIRPAQPLTPPAPAVYQPVTSAGFGAPSQQGVTVVVRVRPGFDAATRLRREIHDFDPNVTVFNVRRMEDLVEQVYYIVRVATSIYGAMGVFALILATVGLAGVTAYSVARRAHEIGIRIALGARGRDILGLVLGESTGIIAVGGAAGLALSWAVLRALNSLFETMAEVTRISASDPRLLAGAPALLVVLALLACYVPAQKSTRTDPTLALKAE
jgi:hypothetical protein